MKKYIPLCFISILAITTCCYASYMNKSYNKLLIDRVSHTNKHRHTVSCPDPVVLTKKIRGFSEYGDGTLKITSKDTSIPNDLVLTGKYPDGFLYFMGVWGISIEKPTRRVYCTYTSYFSDGYNKNVKLPVILRLGTEEALRSYSRDSEVKMTPRSIEIYDLKR
jgi:hypothetical protein